MHWRGIGKLFTIRRRLRRALNTHSRRRRLMNNFPPLKGKRATENQKLKILKTKN